MSSGTTVPGTDLTVLDVTAETADAVSITFAVPDQDRDRFRYRPGQFLTLQVPTAQGPVSRCYSLSSLDGTDPHPRVTVKRVPDGRASPWLVDELRPGATLRSLRPAGTFTPRADPASAGRPTLLYAAGSGITPVFAILRQVIAVGSGPVRLFYANRDRASTIFAGQLTALVEAEDRLEVTWWHEVEQGGLPTEDAVATFIGTDVGAEHYICGPEPYMRMVLSALDGLGADPLTCHTEVFESDQGDPFAPARSEDASASPRHRREEGREVRLAVTLDGERRVLPWSVDRSLLDVLLDAGIDAPYSCREGTCSACACVLLKGSVDLRVNNVLDAADLADGLILGCQAFATAAEVHVDFDA